MRLTYRHATVLVCSAVVGGWISPVSAHPVHHHRHFRHTAQHHHVTSRMTHRHHQYRSQRNATAEGASGASAWNDDRYAVMRADWARAHEVRIRVPRTRGPRVVRHRSRRVTIRTAHAVSGFTSSALVVDARRYIGTNPTGRRSLWCGAFMDKILRDTGHRGGGNLALGYAHYGHRISGPRVGAIAVMRRRGGGHVGVVSGIDSHGNPIIISGNHNHTVAEAVYPRGRIVAYVVPNQ